MLSTVSSAAPTRTLVGQRRQPVMKPEVVVRYNNTMGGVDVADQYSVYYSFTRKSMKWSRKAMFSAIEVGLVNSYILYKQTATKPVSHLHYLTLTLSTGDHPKPLQQFSY